MDRTFSNKRLIPLDIVFSSSRLGDGSEALAPFADVPICVLEPLQKALECAQNGQPLPDEYFRLLAGEPTDTRAREQLTRELRRQLSPLARLVSRAQPTIDRIDRDRLVLADGHLQCAVAKARGKTWIKARMDDATAAAWDARPRAALDAVLGAQGRTATYTPIMHADYRKLKVSRSGTRRLDLMRQFLGPVHRRLSVLDIGCNTGYYAFHFYRQGFDAAGIDIDEEHLAVARALSELYSAPIPLELGRMQDFTPGKPFDVCLGLSVFWHIRCLFVVKPESSRVARCFVSHARRWLARWMRDGSRKEPRCRTFDY